MQLPAAEAAKAEALARLAGALSISLDDAGDDPVLEPPPGEAPLWPTLVFRALFPIEADLAPLAALLKDACAAREITIDLSTMRSGRRRCVA